MLQICIKSTLYYAWISLEYVIIEYFSDQIPSHNSDPAVSVLNKPQNPPIRLKLLDITNSCCIKLY